MSTSACEMAEAFGGGVMQNMALAWLRTSRLRGSAAPRPRALTPLRLFLLSAVYGPAS